MKENVPPAPASECTEMSVFSNSQPSSFMPMRNEKVPGPLHSFPALGGRCETLEIHAKICQL